VLDNARVHTSQQVQERRASLIRLSEPLTQGFGDRGCQCRSLPLGLRSPVPASRGGDLNAQVYIRLRNTLLTSFSGFPFFWLPLSEPRIYSFH